MPMLMQISDLMAGPPEIAGYEAVDQSLVQLIPPIAQSGDTYAPEAHGAG
jgi:hypothetical protein